MANPKLCDPTQGRNTNLIAPRQIMMMKRLIGFVLANGPVRVRDLARRDRGRPEREESAA